MRILLKKIFTGLFLFLIVAAMSFSASSKANPNSWLLSSVIKPAKPNTVKSQILDFKVNPKILTNTKLIVSTEYFRDFRKFFSRHAFNDFDFLDMKKFGRQRILVSKGAFIIKRPVTDFTEKLLVSEKFIRTIMPGIKEVKGDPKIKNKFYITKITNTIIKRMEVRFTAVGEFFSKADIKPGSVQSYIVTHYDSGYGVPDAYLKQTVFDFNKAMNAISQIVRFYSLGPKETLVITNQVVSAQSKFASKIEFIPFVSFRKMFTKEIIEALEKFSSRIVLL